MQKIICFVMLLGLTLQLSAQRDNTLVNSTGRVGLFFSTSMEFNQPVNDVNSFGGGGFGIVLSDFFIGGYGSAGANFDELIYNDDIETIELAHGGLWFGFTPFQHYVIHPFASVRTGWGGVGIDVDDWDDWDDQDEFDSVFVVTPEVGLEVNVFRFMRIAGSVSYRQVNGINNSNYASDAFDGVGGRVALKFGWFGRNRKHEHNHRKWWKW
ncbi:MAG: hypothetical protein AB8G22_24370 [Saprospiraceae bacterium]